MPHSSVKKSILDFLRGLLLAGALLLCLPGEASAYVDPGTGAMLWQLLAAAVLGFLFYARRIITWVRTRIWAVSGRAAANRVEEHK